MSRFALFGVLCFGVGCGYAIGHDALYQVRSVEMRILYTRSERRLHEFELSQAVSRELLGSGIRVNSPSAKHVLTGRIEAFEQPVLVVDANDVPLVGSVSVRLRIQLTEKNKKEPIVEEVRTESAGFTNQRNESAETARREVFDRLARWVVTKLERRWSYKR